MVIKTLTCNFSQSKIYPGHGKLFIRIDSKVGGPPPPPPQRRGPPWDAAWPRCPGTRPSRPSTSHPDSPACVRPAAMQLHQRQECLVVPPKVEPAQDGVDAGALPRAAARCVLRRWLTRGVICCLCIAVPPHAQEGRGRREAGSEEDPQGEHFQVARCFRCVDRGDQEEARPVGGRARHSPGQGSPVRLPTPPRALPDESSGRVQLGRPAYRSLPCSRSRDVPAAHPCSVACVGLP